MTHRTSRRSYSRRYATVLFPFFSPSCGLLVSGVANHATLTQVRKSNQRFEVRLMMMNLLSRLIACHRLILPNFYPWLQKYMQPHQQHVTHILAYETHLCHHPLSRELLLRRFLSFLLSSGYLANLFLQVRSAVLPRSGASRYH
jgi:hypothetical protein